MPQVQYIILQNWTREKWLKFIFHRLINIEEFSNLHYDSDS